VELRIRASRSVLSGDEATLQKVYRHFHFFDKAADAQLRRFKKGLRFKERAIYQAHGELPESYLSWKNSKLEELKKNVTVFCCEWENPDLILPTGLVPTLLQFLSKSNVTPKLIDERSWDLSRKLLLGPQPTLRKPQAQSLEVLTNERPSEIRGLGLIRVATGVGKTALAQELIRALGVRSIFLVPSLPILKQTAKRFEQALGKKNVKVYGGGKKDIGYVTVATYQSVYKGDHADFHGIDLVIADEVHHVSADTFNAVMMNHLAHTVHRYGLTAHEVRADNSTMLIEAAVGPVVYSYSAAEAIEDGYLARPTYVIYDVWSTEGSWTRYKIREGKRVATGTYPCTEYDGDDDILAYRNWVLGNSKLNSFVAQLAEGFIAEGKSVLILVDEKEHGEKLKQLIPLAGFAIGGSKDNERLQKEFNARRLKCLIGTSTLGEGADTIPVDVLIELQGGASYSKTLQADGRALRNDPDENGVPRKPTTLIIDFNFPLCQMLCRHSKAREQVHKTMGIIHRGQVI
jgi:superfamily II DNA or RNA helicase